MYFVFDPDQASLCSMTEPDPTLISPFGTPIELVLVAVSLVKPLFSAWLFMWLRLKAQKRVGPKPD